MDDTTDSKTLKHAAHGCTMAIDVRPLGDLPVPYCRCEREPAAAGTAPQMTGYALPPALRFRHTAYETGTASWSDTLFSVF